MVGGLGEEGRTEGTWKKSEGSGMGRKMVHSTPYDSVKCQM